MLLISKLLKSKIMDKILLKTKWEGIKITIENIFIYFFIFNYIVQAYID